MIINRRQIGAKSGYWTGIEIEHTKFVGLRTIIFCRYTQLRHKLGKAIDYEHIFIPIIDPKFFEHNEDSNLGHVLDIVRFLLRQEKKVTIEADITYSTESSLVQLRKEYPDTFCLLLVAEVPEVEVGAFAIKAAPSVVFEERENERGVFTADFARFIPTYWPEYERDKDGE